MINLNWNRVEPWLQRRELHPSRKASTNMNHPGQLCAVFFTIISRQGKKVMAIKKTRLPLFHSGHFVIILPCEKPLFSYSEPPFSFCLVLKNVDVCFLNTDVCFHFDIFLLHLCQTRCWHGLLGLWWLLTVEVLFCVQPPSLLGFKILSFSDTHPVPCPRPASNLPCPPESLLSPFVRGLPLPPTWSHSEMARYHFFSFHDTQLCLESPQNPGLNP